MNRAPKFLIVDDSEDNRFLTRYALTKAFPGSQVVEWATGEAALAAADAQSFDGVITDHHLGNIDGGAFLQALRSRGLSCPVIMVTASSDPRVHQRAYAAGAAHVFAGTDFDFVGFFRRRLSHPDEDGKTSG